MSGQLGVPVGFIAGLFTGVGVVALTVLLWRQLRPALTRLRYLLAAGLLVAGVIAAGAMYLAIGTHAGADGTGSAPVSAPGTAEQGGAAQSAPPLGDAGATPVSRTSAAPLAVTASTSTDSAPPPPPLLRPAASAAAPDAASTAELESRVSSHPEDASAWLALAEQRRVQHDYAGARAAYAKVAGLEGMSAQSWAGYAEVLSSLAGGSLSGEAGTAVDNALRLDAWNPKAMWLKASQAYEQHAYGEAIVWLRRLRAVLPPGSPDGPIVEAKIAEAETLSQPTPPPPPTPPVQVGR